MGRCRDQEAEPDVKLPSQAIAVVRRSDGSGTTFIFTDYLAQASAGWKDKVGTATAVQWPTGLGAKGRSRKGVAGDVTQTAGSIGYVVRVCEAEPNVAHAHGEQGRRDSEPNAKTFQAAAVGADWEKAQGFNVILTNAPGAESWPIAGATSS